MGCEARRLVLLADVDENGRRWPVLATSDPHVVAAVERAIRERVPEQLEGEPTRQMAEA